MLSEGEIGGESREPFNYLIENSVKNAIFVGKGKKKTKRKQKINFDRN